MFTKTLKPAAVIAAAAIAFSGALLSATPAVASPSTRDTAVHIRKPESVSVEPRMELSTV